MSNLNDKLKKITSAKPSKWKERAEFRSSRPWLKKYSSQIARRILAVIEKDEELNQVKLAQSLNVKPQQVSKIIKGRENLTLETIYNLSQALGVELITFPTYKYNTTKLGLQSVISNSPTVIADLPSDNAINGYNNVINFQKLSTTTEMGSYESKDVIDHPIQRKVG